MRRITCPLLLGAVAASLVAGCGGGTPSSTGTGAATVPVTTGGIDSMEGASTAPATVPATNEETALLTGVRAARHEGYDRVVFAFRNALPGYDVRYTERPVLADGSGAEVSVDGAHVVRVRMQSALDADLSIESAPRTYLGPDRLSPGLPEVVELVRTGGFEGVLTWVVGLNDRVDFRVTTLAEPPRLVIDFRNH